MVKKIGIIFGMLIVLLNCSAENSGSGGGIGGSGVSPIPTPTFASGATLGSISGFGSVVVNGERFNTDNATFLSNELAVAQNDLRIGMNILAAVDFSSNVANEVNYVPSLVGPVESINLASKTFNSFGQTVQLGAATSYENITLSEIAVGMVVEVSGLRNATGKIYATFIRLAPNPARYQLTGAILSEIGSTQLFSLNGLQVNFAEADLSKITADEMNFGDKVHVMAESTGYIPDQNLLNTDLVRVALEPMLRAGDRVEYEGIVSAVTSVYDFDVYWQPIKATEQTRVEFQDGGVAELSMILRNTRVEVEAIVQSDGSYEATKIILIPTENSKITGVVDGIAIDKNTISMLGLDIQINDDTRVDGLSFSDGGVAQQFLGQLNIGAYLEVEALFVGDVLIASRVEIDEQDDRADLKGPVTSIEPASDSIMIIGQMIKLGARTEYGDSDDMEITKQEFLDLVQLGVVVKARWDDFGSVALPPDSLEIE